MKAVLCGYYGMGNGGDEALLATLLQMLPPTVEPLVLSGNPEETSQRYGVTALARKHPGSIMAALRQADVLIWGGGSLLQDTTSLQNPLYYTGLMILAQWLGLKTIAWGQGIGPLRHRLSRALGCYALNRCQAVSVRDSRSLAWLTRWGVTALQAADPVWALTPALAPDLADLPNPRVAVALRPHPWLTRPRLEQLTQALASFQDLTQAAILLVPFQPSQDLAIAEQIQTYLTGPSQICSLADPRQLKGLFQGVRMTIGMRFHALIMAAATGGRSFALSYDPKVLALLEDVKLPGFDLDPHNAQGVHRWPTSVEALTQAWWQVYSQGSPLAAVEIQTQLERARLHQQMLYNLLA
ncbi:MAG: polysaccharide pyruvyl transferase CsaB [Cyanobacteria bacterium REEB459]|nr:polysaccharide pyruvyl transferase CsaB [Cyanobacteria bacterium REEB459]